jgi:2-polyprenyl-6-methoxyphenol hydroxylase-like FAD-dependent oxidoreductase
MAAAPHPETDVLVVGAGPVGLTMACELRRHGVSCRIVDQNEGPTPLNESRAMGIQARTLEVFRDVGVIDPVLSQGKKLHGVSAYSGGRRIFHIVFDLEGVDTEYPYVLGLPQSRTERVLIERLESHGVQVERDRKLESFDLVDGGVTARFEGVPATVRSAWIVGCDGARSVVRKQLGFEFEGAEYEERFLLADVHLAWSKPTDEITLVMTPDGPIAAFPFSEEGRWRLVDTSGKVDTSDPTAIVARFREQVRSHAEADATVDDPSWTSSFHLHRRVVDRYRSGRAFVAGDAAHLHSPVGGQGMNTGIQDAYNLAWKLALVIKGRAHETLLDSYSSERRPVAVAVLKGSDQVTRVVTLRSEIAQHLRDRLLSVLTELDFVRKKVSVGASELNVGYRDSPIVAEHHAGVVDLLRREGPGLRGYLDFVAGPHPGDRAPDVVLQGDAPSDTAPRLHDLFLGTNHTLLLFEAKADGPISAIADLIATCHADLIRAVLVHRGPERPDGWSGDVLSDPDGAIHERYGARTDCLYLVRPDGYIGFRCQPIDVESLRAYLESIFL